MKSRYFRAPLHCSISVLVANSNSQGSCFSIVAGQQLHKINSIIGINSLHDRFKTYFVGHLCAITTLSLLRKFVNALKVFIFGIAAGLQLATLLKMNSYTGFYQGFLELNMLKRRICGGLFLPLKPRLVNSSEIVIRAYDQNRTE